MASLTGEGLVSRRGHSETLREASKDKPAALESFPVDETPTPTKILKMADEVGLFHDLRDNPFDAHFRKATEAVKLGADSLSASIAATEIPEEESLNTPHIYPTPGDTPGPSSAPAPRPVLLRANSRSRPFVPLTTRMPFVPVASVQPVKTSGFKPIAPNGPVSILQQSTPAGAVLSTGAQDGTENALLLLKFPSGETIKLSNLPFVKEESSSAANVAVSNPAKLKLKETLINNSNSAAFASKRSNAESISELAVVEAREANYDLGITAGPSLSKKMRSSSFDEVEKMLMASNSNRLQLLDQYSLSFELLPPSTTALDQKHLEQKQKKKDIQERNRASAQRSRNKKRDEYEKTLIKCKDLEKKTGMLEMENSILREEVVKLKTLLAKHANCQITKNCNDEEKIKSIVEPRVILPTNLGTSVQSELKLLPTCSQPEVKLLPGKSPIIVNSPENTNPQGSLLLPAKPPFLLNSPERTNPPGSIVMIPVSEDPLRLSPSSASTAVYIKKNNSLIAAQKMNPSVSIISHPKAESSQCILAPSESFPRVPKEPPHQLDAPINLTSGSHVEIPQIATNIIQLPKDSPPQTVPEDLRVDHSRTKSHDSDHCSNFVNPVKDEVTELSSPGYVRVTSNSICVKQTLARHCQRVATEKHEIREKKGKVAKRLKDKLLDLKMKMAEEVEPNEVPEAPSYIND